MFSFLISLAILTLLLWVGYKITGALLKACIWLFIRVPVALLVWGVALVCCCTILLIPVGLKLFGIGGRILIP